MGWIRRVTLMVKERICTLNILWSIGGMAKTVLIRPLYVLHKENPYFQRLPIEVRKTLWKFNERELRLPYIGKVFMPLVDKPWGDVIIRYHHTDTAIDWWFEKVKGTDDG